MKTAKQILLDCEALQELEHLTPNNWHDMAEADARLIANRVDPRKVLSDAQSVELAMASQRLLLYSFWCRSYTTAVKALTR